MKMSKISWLAVAVLGAGLIVNSFAQSGTKVQEPPQVVQGLKTGGAAPDFTLPDTNGEEHSLSDYKGKTVVLEWTNYDCPFVKKFYANSDMQKIQAEYTGKDVVWLSICSSADGKQGNYEADKWNEMMESKEVSASAVLLDPAGEVGKQYSAKTTPHMYVIDSEGTLVYQGAIDSIRSADSSDIAKAQNYVKACLNATLNGEPVGTSSTAPYGCSVKYK